jgi:hypothetical protein
VRCGHGVRKNAKHFETFEKTHWVWFHLEFEHGEFDPDEQCTHGCFWHSQSPEEFIPKR